MQLHGLSKIFQKSFYNLVKKLVKFFFNGFRKLTVLMETYPIRIKALHFINPPAGFEMVFKIFKAVVSEKIGKRVFVHSSFEDLHKVVSKSLLPVEYGGENATVSEIAGDKY